MKRNRICIILAVFIGLFFQSGCQKTDQPPVSASTPTPPPSHMFSGTLFFLDGPLTNADASLNLLSDEQCVNILTKDNPSPDELKRLESCRQYRFVKVRPDEQGNYKLTPPSPGWYQVMIEWRTDRLGQIAGIARAEPFLVRYAPIMFKPGHPKYMPGATYFLATAGPIYFTGKEDFTMNLQFRK